jgi:Immunity protein 8
MKAELKGLISPDLRKPLTPEDPMNCSVLIEANIGQKGSDGSEIFNFVVVTPQWLVANSEVRWGKGYLLLPEFSWQEIERMIGRLITSASGESWQEIAIKLSKYMDWEFEGYGS